MNKRPDKSATYGRFDLIPPVAMHRLALLFARDAKEYEPRDWEQGYPLSRYMNDALIHLNLLQAGDGSDDHAMRVVWNMVAFVANEHMIKSGRLSADLNDLPFPIPNFDTPLVTAAPAQIQVLTAPSIPALSAPSTVPESQTQETQIEVPMIPAIPAIPEIPSNKKQK